MRVSFCIPTYESKGKAQRYLFDIFYALSHQTNKNFNVWISDHSKTDVVLEACKEYANEFEINYVKESVDLLAIVPLMLTRLVCHST